MPTSCFSFSRVSVPSGIGLVLMIGAAVLLSACGAESASAPPLEPPVRPVKMHTVQEAGATPAREYPGTVSAAETATLSFELPGTVVDLPVQEGERVEAGQLIARLDGTDAQSRLQSARATRNAARSAYERAKSLYAQGIVSQQQLEARQREYEVAQSQLEQAQTQVGDTRITAPFDGRVAEKMVELNENVGPQQPVVTVQDLSRMEVVIDVPEQSRMRRALQSESLAVTFSMRPGRRLPATLKEITTTADPRTRTYEATLTIRPPDDAGILPGMTARAIVGGGPASAADGAGAIAIPTSAVFSRSGETASVWTVRDSSTTVARRSVSLGTMRDSTVVVTSGLQAGDRIAATGVHQLNDGQPVRPLE
ncbi:efflux RND transporter periplasmic adaptor subunit [Salinibacter ruber]|uniref:RND family efflux transporter MFP subunit n=2 Tax=Salinibacter ruber TaxID=146919 RepID=A0A9X2ZMB9_9BACT|nr:efflux RND transporter periplasmic adaptor subunit [Salinibacter ruber]MCS3859540.1 RND family efflux transporter MFP subunit [Salinibacter ruber]MCS3866380.1 RND family efflux transporter MFP subunit [Salinibacter ruber]MCS4151700.1 RND family efflux transporter MFP subunit [Salinibacter ruber]MCS4178494.1 RND family efflux transporter MFP subunit [Salinibacter ruber]